MARIKGSLSKIVAKKVEKGEIVSSEASKHVDNDFKRIHPTTKLEDAKDCDLIIEAIAENMVVNSAKLI